MKGWLVRAIYSVFRSGAAVHGYRTVLRIMAEYVSAAFVAVRRIFVSSTTVKIFSKYSHSTVVCAKHSRNIRPSW